MTTVKDFQSFLKAIINSSRGKAGKTSGATVREIKRDLLFHENIDVDKFVAEQGHRDLLDLIKEWDEFTIHYNSFDPIVRVISSCGDHISKMNQHSKQKRGTINSFAKKINSSPRLKAIYGPDPYSLSRKSSLDVFNGEQLPKENFSSITDDEFDDLVYLNMIGNSNAKKSDKTDAKNNQELTTPSKKLPIKGINQILADLKTPSSKIMIPTTSKAVSKDSIFHSQVRHTPRQKMSIYKNVSNSIPFKLVKTIDQLILSCKPLNPKVKNVIAMLDVVNPHRFWFAEYNEYKELLKLMENMQEFYTANQDSLRIDSKDLQRGLYVAALFDSIWHRGMIIKKDENFVRIYYVDFGTSDDARHIDLCYLKADFLNLPCVARRGVLAFIQPNHSNKWNDEARIFFENFTKNTKIDIKIFDYNTRDNSYYLGIKRKNEQKVSELLVDKMIQNGHARADKDFLVNTVISSDSYEFHEYEEGILLDIEPEVDDEIESFDSWVPFKISKMPVQVPFEVSKMPVQVPFEVSKMPAQVPKKIYSPTSISSTNSNKTSRKRSSRKAFTPPIKKKSEISMNQPTENNYEVKRNLTNEFNDIVDQQEKQTENVQKAVIIHQQTNVQVNQMSSLTNSSNSAIIPSKILAKCPSVIKKQSFEKLIIGQNLEIVLNVFYEPSCFFFYIKQEMADIKKFLDDLNETYKKHKEKFLNEEDLCINKEVAIFNDESYCRGSINSKIENLYQVFLIDFGIFVTRKYDEIFRLQKEFTKRQRCVYKGCTRDKMNTKNKSFIVVKILGIRNEDTVDLKVEGL